MMSFWSDCFAQVYVLQKPVKKTTEQQALFRSTATKQDGSDLFYVYVRNCGNVQIQKHHKTNDLPKENEQINIFKVSNCEIQEWEPIK